MDDKIGAELLVRPGGITDEDVARAITVLRRYKDGKKNLEDRIVEDEQWYQLRHWEAVRRKSEKREPDPTSAWLFNTIMNKHADAMDNYPRANVLPRAGDDRDAAKQLSQIIPCILEYNDFEQCYSDNWWEKLKHGTAAYYVGWNKDKENGLGDVEIKPVDLLNIFWEPGISNIQDSRNLFIVALVDNDVLETEYPELQGQEFGKAIEVKEYFKQDEVDTANKSVVVDWYYRVRNAMGVQTVHMVKFVGNKLLYASQNDEDYSVRGLYDHGEYPVEFDIMFPEKGTPAGFGVIAVTKDPQLYIDKLSGNILKHSMMSTSPRYYASKSMGINKKQFLDWAEPIVDVEGQINNERLQPITVPNLDGTVVNVLQLKIDELKETSGNRDVNSGSAGSGVTAAAAISALQEAGNKVSRDTIAAAYRCYARIGYKVLELIRQFYDEPREFRITNEGAEEYTTFDNSGIKDVVTGQFEGQDMFRRPVFDIKIVAEKKNPFSQMTQNEYAKEFYKLGFFAPEKAQESMIALSMMDFEGKDAVLEKVEQGQTLYNILLQMSAQMDKMALIIQAMTGEDMGIGDGNPLSLSPLARTAPSSEGAKGVAKSAVDSQRQNMTSYQQKAAKRAAPDMGAVNGL